MVEANGMVSLMYVGTGSVVFALCTDHPFEFRVLDYWGHAVHDGTNDEHHYGTDYVRQGNTTLHDGTDYVRQGTTTLSDRNRGVFSPGFLGRSISVDNYHRRQQWFGRQLRVGGLFPFRLFRLVPWRVSFFVLLKIRSAVVAILVALTS